MPKQLLDVYGDQLSGLIPVEWGAICSTKGGEHCYNCEYGCIYNSISCGCQKAQSCCRPIVEEFADWCIICEITEIQNLNFDAVSFSSTYSDTAIMVKENIQQFRTVEACNGISSYAATSGCLYLEEDPNTI